MDNFKNSFSLEKFEKLTDITLKTEDGSIFKSHKILLAQASKYFEILFCGNFQQTDQTLVPIFKGDVLHQILRYIIQNADVLTEENVSDILLASDYLAIDDLIIRCKIFLFNKGCTVDNCIKVYNTAWWLEMKDIKVKCKRFIEINTADVFANSKTDIINLSLVAFKEILECDHLNIPNESLVWNIMIAWIKGNIFNRIAYFPELLRYIRLQEMDETANNIELLPIIENSHFCFGLNQSKFELSCAIKQAKTLPLSITGLRSRVPSKIYFICRQAEDEDAELCITYDERFDYCYYLDRLPKQFCIECCDICVAGRFVYFSFYNYPTEIKAFDLLLEIWVPVSKAHERLTSYSVVSVDDNIYALGGRTFTEEEEAEDEEVYMSESDDNDESTEDMDVDFDEMSAEKSEDMNEDLNEAESIVEATFSEEEETEDEEISSSEADDDENLTDEEENMDVDWDETSFDEIEDTDEDLYEEERIVGVVQRYNSETDSWYLVSPMTSVNIMNVVVLNNKIFVIGLTKDFENQVCQVYDTSEDTWTVIPNPAFYRSNYCASAVFCGKLYLIGGQDKNYNVINKVEVYNAIENLWRTIADLPSIYYNPKATVVNEKLIVFDIGKIDYWTEYLLEENVNSVFLDSEQNAWREATFINRDLLMEMRFCQFITIDNANLLNELTRKHKRMRSVWAKSNLSDLA
ncbi:kelch-like protein 12 [Parasteatoda tepidariorum]|uniref:kelch-like protein 12 n=1 Tax=Parasteatoda tepidariorum TaxID=114398 RepID=UPI001C72086B|nr:kelch-like protein 38 [Parasteatoda tepidariorum]